MIGYEYFEHDGFAWRKHQQALVPLSMPHSDPNLSRAEAAALMRTHGCPLMRWDSNFDTTDNRNWWHVIKTDKTGLSDLKAKARNQVRRGIKSFTPKACTAEVIMSEGYAVYEAAFARYDTFEDKFSKEAFVAAIKALPTETEFWELRETGTGRLVGFSENLVRDNACIYVTAWFDPQSMREYSSYALFFEMNRHYLDDRKLRYVSDGARNINHATSIHEFLISKFGFRKAYADLNVSYVGWLGLAVKMTYPFRGLIAKIPLGPFKKVTVLLRQESIIRGALQDETAA